MPQQITKLSQAMRKGAKQTYQIRDDFISHNRQDGKFGACALGAAAIALGLNAKEDFDDEEQAVLDIIKERLGLKLNDIDVKPPADTGYRYERPISEMVYKLNDDAEWGIKEIANWLEGLGY